MNKLTAKPPDVLVVDDDEAARLMMAVTLEKAGFEITHVQYFDILGILPWFIVCKLLSKEPNSKNVSVYDKFVVPIAKIIETIFPIPIGKNLLLVAKKT